MYYIFFSLIVLFGGLVMGKELLNITTTVRNPTRLLDFLKTLSRLEGDYWNHDTQKLFQIFLIQDRNYKPTPKDLNSDEIALLNNPNIGMTLDQATEIFYSKDYHDSPMRGRTSFSPLKEFGLAYIDDKYIRVTELGDNLLNDKIDFNEMFFQWSLKWQFPNPISTKLKDGTDIKPFVGFLKLIEKVNEKCLEKGLTVKGVSKYEFNLFVLSFTNHNYLEKTANDILSFRENIEKITSHSDRRKFYEDQLDFNLSDYSNFSTSNVRDYADNILRCYLLTGLVRLRGGGFYLDHTPEKQEIIESILKNVATKSEDFTSEEDYLDYLGDTSKPKLDFSNKQIVYSQRQEIKRIMKETSVDYKVDDIQDSKQLDQIKKNLLNLMFKEKYSNVNGISNIMNNLSNIRKLDMKPSIALEYWISKALTVLNNVEIIKPNYLTDSDNNIVFTAGGNVGDIECYYSYFNMLCEVTLQNSRSQWYNEGQPVMRHFKDFLDSDNKPAYCLFIAPSIHRDTINTFWTSIKYEYEGTQLNIIPLTLQQFNKILDIQKRHFMRNEKLSSETLEKLFLDLINIEKVKTSDEWRMHMKNTIESFVREY